VKAHPDPHGTPDVTPIVPGSTLVNPVTGELATLIEAPWDNADGRLTAELMVKPGGRFTGEHRHPTMLERFSGIDGELTVSFEGAVDVLPVGQTLEIVPGSWHDWWNASDREVRVRVETVPGERFMHMVETLYGLAREGHTNEQGLPNLLQLSVFGAEFADVMEFRSPPPWAQRILFTVVGMVARPLGYRGTYPQFSRTTMAPRDGAGEAP